MGLSWDLIPMNRDPHQRTEAPSRADVELNEGGDPACWAHLVCPECGLLNSTKHPNRCEGCGASFPDDEDW
jgi:hypothetical protein